MKRYTPTAFALTVLAAAILLSRAPEGETPEWKGTIKAEEKISEVGMADLAKIPLDQALTKALEKVPGKPVKAEVESEDGCLIYGVEIVTADKELKEVILNPADGKVLAVEDEAAHDKGEWNTEDTRTKSHG